MTITNPAPAPLAMCTISTDSGPTTIVCEPISDSIVITPAFGMDDEGKTWLLGGFVLTHVPTGGSISEGQGCIECCRANGRALAALPVDWSALTKTNAADWSAGWPDDLKSKFSDYRAVEWGCDAENCERITPDGGAS